MCQIKYYPLQFTEQTFYPSIPSPIGLRLHSLYQLYILIHLPQFPFLPFDKPTWKVEDTLDLIGLFQQKNPSIYLPICRLILPSYSLLSKICGEPHPGSIVSATRYREWTKKEDEARHRDTDDGTRCDGTMRGRIRIDLAEKTPRVRHSQP